jgi:hypothetical protein
VLGLRQGQITIADNAPDSPQSMPLSGNGVTPAVSLLPGSLIFPGQYILSSSAPQMVAVTNAGTGTLTIASIAASGDYQQANNCGSNLLPGGSCSIYVTFTPTVLGQDNGALTVSDNASGSPESVPLSGMGAVAMVSLSPASLSFANQDIFTSSAQQDVTLTNVGTAALTINSINATGDYQQTNNCGSSLPAGNSCTIYFSFIPTTLGGDNETATLSDNAVDSPQTMSLTGTGVTSLVSFSPSSVSFSTQAVGTTSAPQNVILTNLELVALNFTSIVSSNPDFAESDDCSPSVPAGAFCTISLSFTPSLINAENATLTMTDDAADSPQSMAVSGNGTVAAVALSPASLNFGAQSVGTTSAAQIVTMTNVGTGITNLAGISAINPDYVQTNNCPAILNPGDSCTISVTFTPSLTGTDPGTISVRDDAPASPQQLSLSGGGN